MENNIARELKWDGDAIMQSFIYALEDSNFHSEAKILCAAWDAMARAEYNDSRDKQNLVTAARKALENLNLGD
jgi:hypothetical protein